MLQKLRRMFIPGNLLFRLALQNCLMLLLVTAVTVLAGNYVYQNAMISKSISDTMELQESVVRSLDLIFEDASRSMEMIERTPCVQEYLEIKGSDDEPERVRLEGEVRSLLLLYSGRYPDYKSIVLVSENGQYLSNDSYRIQKRPLSNDQWYREAGAGELTVVHGSANLLRNLKSWKNYSMDSIISISRQMQDSESGEKLGVILIDLDLASIANLVNDITMDGTGVGLILDSQNQVLYAPNSRLVYRINPDWFTDDESGMLKAELEGSVYYVTYHRSQETGMTAVGIFGQEKIEESVRKVQRISIWIAVAVMLVSLVSSFLLTLSFTRPISELSSLMGKAQTGDLKVRFDNHYSGEVGQLGDSFNNMVGQIEKLVGMVYHDQEEMRKAELKILHEQIKPHFLYNTLDTIQYMAKEHDAPEIVDLVLALSAFFRTSLSQGKEYIPLDEEVEMVRNYLDIQKVRYEDLFDYETDISPEIRKEPVLRLSLQPLVENALYHGIKESEKEQGLIRITGRAEGEYLILAVEDDGAGMDEELMERFNKEFGAADDLAGSGEDLAGDRDGLAGSGEDLAVIGNDTGGAFGTRNVNERIRIAYGKECGLHFEQMPGGGTRAVLRMKRSREKENNVEGTDCG